MVIDDATVLFPDVSTDGKVEIFVANTKLGKISASHTNILDPLGILGRRGEGCDLCKFMSSQNLF